MKSIRMRLSRLGQSLDYFAAHVSGLFEHVFLIVDGLDECQGQNRAEMFGTCVPPNMHVLASSRPEHDIEEAFTGRTHMEMEREAVMVDIKCYIASRLENERKLKNISRSLKEKIREKLLAKSAGM
jgi:hypothetical protein